MIRIAIVTVGRSDWSIYRPVVEEMQRDNRVEPLIVAGGSHWSPRDAMSVKTLEQTIVISEKVAMSPASDSGADISKSIARGVAGFTRAFVRLAPDWILLLGDRFEMLSASVAAAPLKIPTAHLHGGEATLGALDDNFRHAITKLSHLHFVSTRSYGERVRQLGEEPWRVVVCGAPALEQVKRQSRRFTFREIARQLDVPLRPNPLLVTYHPETLSHQSPISDFGEVLAALDRLDLPIIFTAPNADEGSATVRQMISTFLKRKTHARFFENLGEYYYSAMRFCAAVVGNSSSGIIEAASLKIPVVNIGDRQSGRIHGRNVLNVPHHCAAILAGIRKVLTPEFRQTAAQVRNPYQPASIPPSRVIVHSLVKFRQKNDLLRKKFCDFAMQRAR